jgi:hypothetical protein
MTIPPLPARSATLSERFYFPELDAIRVFLFLGVWAYHALPLQDHYYVEHRIPQQPSRRACAASMSSSF